MIASTPSRIAKKKGRRDRHKLMETPIPEIAIAAYKCLGFEDQVKLVEEIIATRTTELLAAHPGVMGLGIGLKRQRTARGVPQTKPTLLHLRFMVNRKWSEPKNSNASRRGRIPRFLLVGIGPIAHRNLVAIPTDVESKPPPREVKRQSVPIRAWTGKCYEEGAIACVLQQNQAGNRSYFGVSCRHVLSPTGDPAGVGPPANQVDEIGAPPLQLGVATSQRGSMSNLAKLDFDAQLFAFDSAAAAAAVISGGLSLPGSPVSTLNQLSGNLELWAPSGAKALSTTFHTFWKFPEPVVPGLLAHRQLLEMTLTDAATRPGDSGSPLVLQGSAPSIAGMHIALRQIGDELVSLCIPAWDLLNPVLFGMTDKQLVWRVM